MTLTSKLLAALLTGTLLGLAAPSTAMADSQTSEYRIEHGLYGTIGTLTNTVSQIGDTTEVETKVHVAVSVFGMVIYRQEARRIEQWKADRLIKYRSVTATNGNRLEVRGEASDDGFAITSPAGTTTAAGRIHTSNPWSASILNSELIMSSRTGELRKAQVSASRPVVVTVEGEPKTLREYQIVGDGRQLLWLDEDNLPVAFRTEEQGVAVDFVSTRYRSIGSELRQAVRRQEDAAIARQMPLKAPELPAQAAESN